MKHLSTATKSPDATWVPAWWIANAWLLFLIFPISTVLAHGELSTSRKLGAVAALVLFGVANSIGERVLARQVSVPWGPNHPTRRNWVDPDGTLLWFALMLVILGIAMALGGLAALGATPFVVSYAMFAFQWRTAAFITAAALAFVIAAPLIDGTLDELWFFGTIILSVAGGSAAVRGSVEHSNDVNQLKTELLLSEQRQRVSRDVHDVLGHSLTAIVLKTQVTDAILAEINEPTAQITDVREQLSEMHDVSRQALSEIRATVTGLRTGDLNEEIAAARSILSDAGVDLVVTGDSSAVPDKFRPMLGWVVREAVTNIVRHADASTCSIDFTESAALVAVRDDGASGGTDFREGNGLTGLRERLGSMGLNLMIEGSNGTKLSVLAAGAPR